MSLNEELMNTHPEWKKHISRWKFLMDSYLGGDDYKNGEYLLPYLMEDRGEYEARLENTPYDNHVKAITAIYNSFLFREEPKRTFGSIKTDPGLEAFLKDADLDGRSFNSIMREISTYAMVYGHVWCVIDKPQSVAYTRAEELEQGIRPYISIYTPENVVDWNFVRSPSGTYVLEYIKCYEGRSGSNDVFRVYTQDTIQVINNPLDGSAEQIVLNMPNPLGRVPAVPIYSQRSPVKGIGVSIVGDVADMCRAIYNELSENEQILRLTNHPSLVKTYDTQASAGAGAIIQMPPDLQGDLKPYLLQPSGASIEGLLSSIEKKIEAIDRMTHMGGIRSIETRRLSGIGLSTEFQLLNARLAEMADNLEHAEENIWRLYALWQGTVWDGDIDYPDSFNIQDKYNDMNMLKMAKDSGPKSQVLTKVIEEKMLEILASEDEREMYEELLDKEFNIEQPTTEPHQMWSPDGSEMKMVMNYAEHEQLAAQGWTHDDPREEMNG